MIRLAHWLAAFTLVATIAPAFANEWPDALSRRQYQLGMTLAEFMAAPFPDQAQWPGAKPVCSDTINSGDALGAYVDVDAAFLGSIGEVGIIKCQFYTTDGGVYKAGLVLGDIPADTVFYFYPPRADAEPVLFMINTTGPADQFDRLADAFETSLGAPAARSDPEVQNGFGATFRNTQIQYLTPSSAMVFSRFTDTTETFRLMHVLLPVSSLTEAALAAAKTAIADNL